MPEPPPEHRQSLVNPPLRGRSASQVRCGEVQVMLYEAARMAWTVPDCPNERRKGRVFER